MHIYTQPKKAGESLSASSTSGATPAQVVHCPAKPRKDCSDAEKDEESPSVSRMSIELPENVTQCIQKFPKKVESVICDGTCAVGYKLNGGMISTVLWSLNLIPLPRLVNSSLFNFLIGLSRAGILSLGDMGGEEKAVYQADSLSLSRTSSSTADAMVLLVDVGENEEFLDCAPLKIVAPNGSITSVEQEGDGEILSLEAKLNISRWVKRKIPNFSKLVGLSMSSHEKLCIDLLQRRLESKMEAANVLHKEVSGNRKVVKSKNKGRRELRNLISSVNYDGR